MRSEFENWFLSTPTGKALSTPNLGYYIFERHLNEYRDRDVEMAHRAYVYQQSKVDELQKRVDTLTLALDQIAYPIPHMQKEAELNGCELNGYWAVKMSEDHTYSKDIARKALEKEQVIKGD